METKIDCKSAPGVTIKQFYGDVKTRAVRMLDGYGSGARFGVHNNSLNNLVRGVVERVLYTRVEGVLVKPPRPISGVFTRLNGIRARVVRCLSPTTVVSLEDYPLMYSGRKQAVYRRAVDSLLDTDVAKVDANVSPFVKAEKLNFGTKGDAAPRVIQPRDPRYTVSVGRYLKLFEKNLFGAVKSAFGYMAVLKGCNAHQTACQLRESWDLFMEPVAIGLDASRFDQHVSVDALKFEHEFYNRAFNDPKLRKLLSWQLYNCGFGRASNGIVRYVTEGCRMSGDINTSMGNCIIMCCIVIGYFESVGVKARLANNGDDCIVICEARDLSKFDGIDAWFTDFGFKLTRDKPVYVFEQIAFCQTQPVLASDGWRMVRDPRIAPSKDATSLLPWNDEQDFNDWLGAVGQCGSALTRGIPFWESYYARMGVATRSHALEKVVDSGFGYMSKGMHSTAVITAESRYSFWLAFGILPDAQEAMECDPCEIKWCEPAPMTCDYVNSFSRLLHGT